MSYRVIITNISIKCLCHLQVCGPMHREVANCCRYLAMVLYHAGDMGGAIMQQHKELIINERCLGPDHPDTAHR
jgi:protein TIF31